MPFDKNSKSKWQDASNLINSYRWKMSDLLRSFSDEERQSYNYKELLKDVNESGQKAVRDVDPCHSNIPEEKESKADKINWKSIKLWTLILASPVILEIIKALIGLLKKGTS